MIVGTVITTLPLLVFIQRLLRVKSYAKLFASTRGSQSGVICPARDIWQCLKTSVVGTTRGREYHLHLVGREGKGRS